MEELEFEAVVGGLIKILADAFDETPQASLHNIPMGIEYQITLERLRVFALLDRNDFRIDLTPVRDAGLRYSADSVLEILFPWAEVDYNTISTEQWDHVARWVESADLTLGGCVRKAYDFFIDCHNRASFNLRYGPGTIPEL
jgi:hypothetical protein